MELAYLISPATMAMLRLRRRFVLLALAGWAAALGGPVARVWAAGGELLLKAIDYETREPVACRIHLKTQAGKPRLLKSLPNWHDHFVFDGEIKLDLPRGFYQFEVERGPEYANVVGHFEIEDGAEDEKTIELKRGINMAQGGWWSGEFDGRRTTRDLPLLMAAEDLHVLPQVAVLDKRNPKAALAAFDAPPTVSPAHRVFDLRAARDDRDGGSLLFFRLTKPLEFSGARYAKADQLDQLLGIPPSDKVWVDVPQPNSWDLPLWLAAGAVDSIELCNRQLTRTPGKPTEPPGFPRDMNRFTGPHGVGRWSEHIYYHVLNAGLRIPPSAGSGSGLVSNPLGYNRMYVYVGEKFSYDAWWQGLKAGMVVVTNGPLLQPLVQGMRPGHAFRGPAGGELEFDVALTLTTRDPISYLEIVKNGDIERSVRLDDWASHGGKLKELKFKESGWFLIRAVTEVEKTYRFASTAAYYVEMGDQPARISRRSCQFFLDWLDARVKMLSAKKGAKVNLTPYNLAKAYWQQRLSQANVE